MLMFIGGACQLTLAESFSASAAFFAVIDFDDYAGCTFFWC